MSRHRDLAGPTFGSGLKSLCRPELALRARLPGVQLNSNSHICVRRSNIALHVDNPLTSNQYSLVAMRQIAGCGDYRARLGLTRSYVGRVAVRGSLRAVVAAAAAVVRSRHLPACSHSSYHSGGQGPPLSLFVRDQTLPTAVSTRPDVRACCVGPWGAVGSRDRLSSDCAPAVLATRGPAACGA